MTSYTFATQTKIVMIYFYIYNFFQQVSISDRLFFEYDIELELESDNDNTNQSSITNNFFGVYGQEFIQHFLDHIRNELFQTFN